MDTGSVIFLNPVALLAGALALPILLLYMLRLRREETLVSSTFLWQRVLRDDAANTPWQRLRRNLLLLLQLLILALIMLALARPAVSVPAATRGRVALLLDASASMNALEADGRTRWQIAQEQALGLVGQLGIGDEMLALRVADQVTPLSETSSDPLALRLAIEAAQPGAGGADWETALTLAAAAGSSAEDFEIVLLTDGGHGALSSVVLPASVPQPRLITIGEPGGNLAITALAVREMAGEAPQVFAQVRHAGAAPVSAAVTLRLDGVLWASQPLALAASEERALVFAVDRPFETVQASLVISDRSLDRLALDNEAYAVRRGGGARRVLVVNASGSPFITQALGVLPGIQVVQGDAALGRLPTQRYDAYVFEGYLPAELPDADMLIINPPRSSRLFTLGAFTAQAAQRAVLDPAHPLLAYVDFAGVTLRQFRQIQSSTLRPIISSQGGGLLYAGETGTNQVALLPFALGDSDLPLQIAWPILVSNALQWFTPFTQMTSQSAYAPGDTVALRLPLEAARVAVTAPDGSLTALSRGEAFTDTELPGLYRVEAFGEELLAAQWFAVNPPPAESDLTPLYDIPLSGGAPRSTAAERSIRDLSSLFALAALALLLVEWAVYHRQRRPRPRVRPSA
jgi:hypothetical protein